MSLSTRSLINESIVRSGVRSLILSFFPFFPFPLPLPFFLPFFFFPFFPFSTASRKFSSSSFITVSTSFRRISSRTPGRSASRMSSASYFCGKLCVSSLSCQTWQNFSVQACILSTNWLGGNSAGVSSSSSSSLPFFLSSFFLSSFFLSPPFLSSFFFPSPSSSSSGASTMSGGSKIVIDPPGTSGSSGYSGKLPFCSCQLTNHCRTMSIICSRMSTPSSS
mmetsp:Transcript_18424/g.44319  ORF Transcript_18424/g.44319 Transcript_18424/m.44319 type:complete len:221 (+) Transcript_18424:1097-1759(+)